MELAEGATLKRLPDHRTSWFGWSAAYPQTRLVPCGAPVTGSVFGYSFAPH